VTTAALRTSEDVEDFARGTDFLSASGGGSPKATQDCLIGDLEAGLQLGWSHIDTLSDSALVVCTSFAGSIAPETFETQALERELGIERKVERPLVEAVRELESYLGVTFDALIASEIGGINTGHTLDAAIHLGKPMIDADYSGRAVPESTCNVAHMAGKKIAPRALVNFYGDRIVIKSTTNNNMAERLSKHVAMGSLGIVGCAGIILTGREVKEIAVRGTLTRSLDIGRSIRRARATGMDPVDAVTASISDTRLLFRGRIAKRTYENRDGYMWGEHTIAGEGDFLGHEMKVWFKNENHMSWLDGVPFASSPDVLELVDGDSAEPLANTYVSEGQRAALIGVKRCAQFDTLTGIRTLGPRRWGFNTDFRPLETLKVQ
jgi:DUF917 family protein